MRLPQKCGLLKQLANYLQENGSENAQRLLRIPAYLNMITNEGPILENWPYFAGPILDAPDLSQQHADALNHQLTLVELNFQALNGSLNPEHDIMKWTPLSRFNLENLGFLSTGPARAQNVIHKSIFCVWACNIVLGNHIYMGNGVSILDYTVVAIDDNVRIEGGVRLITSSGTKNHKRFTAPIIIEKDVVIKAGAIIMPGVHIEQGAQISAGVVIGAGNIIDAGTQVDENMKENSGNIKLMITNS